MSAQNTLYYKVVAQKQRNTYMLLVAFTQQVVQRNAVQFVTLCNITQYMLQHAVAQMQQAHNAASVTDVTTSSVAKQLQRLFAAH